MFCLLFEFILSIQINQSARIGQTRSQNHYISVYTMISTIEMQPSGFLTEDQETRRRKWGEDLELLKSGVTSESIARGNRLIENTSFGITQRHSISQHCITFIPYKIIGFSSPTSSLLSILVY